VTTRRDARRAAIDIVYQADITGRDPIRVLEEWTEAGRTVPAFGRELVQGLDGHLPDVDLLLEEHVEAWTVARMVALDRTILRVAIEEIVFRDDVPDSVAISEAVEAANELSTEDSGRFVNGILGRIARERAAEGPG
jgi:N utilization substance protein B